MDINAVLTVAGQVAGTAGLVTVSTGAARWVQERAVVHRQADVARQLLGLHQRPLVAYRHDSVHALYSGTEHLHPDNLYALVAASGNDVRRAEAAGRIRIEDNVQARSAHDLALIGSPTAEGLSRVVFGYQQEGDGSDSLRLGSVPVDLPYRWVLSRGQIDEQAVARRMVAGRGLVARPNWRIEGPRKIYIPRVDDDKVLTEDYLLVTRLRNYLSTTALDEGRFILSFGGTHGTGTRALELLYRDESTLRKVAAQLRDQPGSFQLLFRVTEIRHDASRGSYARRIDLAEDAAILADQESIWRTANQIAERSLGELQRS